jgi:hypothetical protein
MKKNKVNRENPNLGVSKEDQLIIEAAKTASSKALRSSKALGLTIQVIKDRKVLEIHPDSSTRELREISKQNIDVSSIKKGVILHRKKLSNG